MINYVVEDRSSGKWVTVRTETNETEIYRSLSNDLISKKINCCTWIKSIKRRPCYNGFDEITVTYSNNVRRIYTVESH